MKFKTKNLVITALGLALALVLPFLTGQIPRFGSMLLPMHIPVLLIGFICGWPYGLVLGVIAAPLRSLIFPMPPMTSAIPMALEMAAYGAVCGILYSKLPKKPVNVYVSLIGAMVAGRIVWGVAAFTAAKMLGNEFTWQLFFAGAIVNAIPGIILQILLLPALVIALKKAGILKD